MRYLLAAGLCLFGQLAAAQDYYPDTRVFDGSNTLRFAANPLLSLPDGGTIEFWVGADWDEDPGYAPVLFQNEGAVTVFQISISPDRKQLNLLADDKYGRFSFDFSDGVMHHVAINDYMDSVYVLVDGRLVGSVAMSFADRSGTDFWIGAGADNQRPFSGAIAGVRIWEGTVDIETLVGFALKNVRDPQDPHPDIEGLIGESAFDDDDFVLADVVVVDAADLPSAIVQNPATGGAEGE